MLTKTLNIKYILKDFLPYCQPSFPNQNPSTQRYPKSAYLYWPPPYNLSMLVTNIFVCLIIS